MKLSYWIAEHLTDSKVYNIREQTRRDDAEAKCAYGATTYGPIHKVTVEYDSAFDLVLQCLEEDGARWEDISP